MNLSRRKGYKVIAVLELFAAAQIAIQIALLHRLRLLPTQFQFPSSLLPGPTTRNNQPITVNGNSATTGASIVTGTTIETGADQSATVQSWTVGNSLI